MKYVKLFENFINEANLAEDFIKKYGKSKSFQPNDFIELNYGGVVSSKNGGLGGKTSPSFIRKTDVVGISSIEAITPADAEMLPKGSIRKAEKEGLIKINRTDDSAEKCIIATPKWFEDNVSFS
jgi:hypothetical protein